MQKFSSLQKKSCMQPCWLMVRYGIIWGIHKINIILDLAPCLQLTSSSVFALWCSKFCTKSTFPFFAAKNIAVHPVPCEGLINSLYTGIWWIFNFFLPHEWHWHQHHLPAKHPFLPYSLYSLPPWVPLDHPTAKFKSIQFGNPSIGTPLKWGHTSLNQNTMHGPQSHKKKCMKLPLTQKRGYLF